MIRIFLADDHTIVREGLRRLIDETPDMEVVGETARGREVLQRAATERWDVLVLDLSLEDVSGIEVLRRLREQESTLPVVVLSMYPEAQYAVRVLKAGAMAYLSKGCSGDELLDAIRAAARGRRYVTAATADALVVRDDGHDGAPHTRLSAREHQVFMLVVEGRGPGDIAAELDISPSTVSTHLLHIREKLGVSTNSEVIQYAYRAGLAPE
jgi:two-component system, NarL family, invasion response regulator UvrY